MDESLLAMHSIYSNCSDWNYQGWRSRWSKTHSYAVWWGWSHGFESRSEQYCKNIFSNLCLLWTPASYTILDPWWCYIDEASISVGCSVLLISSQLNTKAWTVCSDDGWIPLLLSSFYLSEKYSNRRSFLRREHVSTQLNNLNSCWPATVWYIAEGLNDWPVWEGRDWRFDHDPTCNELERNLSFSIYGVKLIDTLIIAMISATWLATVSCKLNWGPILSCFV